MGIDNTEHGAATSRRGYSPKKFRQINGDGCDESRWKMVFELSQLRNYKIAELVRATSEFYFVRKAAYVSLVFVWQLLRKFPFWRPRRGLVVKFVELIASTAVRAEVAYVGLQRQAWNLDYPDTFSNRVKQLGNRDGVRSPTSSLSGKIAISLPMKYRASSGLNLPAPPLLHVAGKPRRVKF